MPAGFPTINGNSIIESLSMRIKTSTVTTMSPFTFQQQTQDFGGKVWEAEVTIRPLTHTEAMQFDAFIQGLGGTVGTFYMGNPLMTHSASTSVTVNGAHTAGDTTINVTSANQGSVVPAGHHIAIGDHLYVTLTHIPINQNNTITITPPLRENANDNAAVVVTQPKGVWRLADPKVEYDISTSGHYSYTFACTEAV